ncbi:hypothetical protein [Streptomyces sp.]|uniref:hypothetical protein n=1 Tax=Streptomyces sp. TaxID=1931 RepID=UPI002D79F1F7|nr:hypothetical protein [Streptomyces sp.]HET6356154.1 hypothetical protein [Streptomyces sp.]
MSIVVDQLSAVIGAGGALLGVFLTGSFALLKGRQDNSEKERDRVEQRRLVQREARRDAYLRFLSIYHEADKKIVALWKTRPDASDAQQVKPEVLEAIDAAEAVREAATEVALEGPAEARTAAYDLYRVVLRSATNLAALNVDHAGSEQLMFQLGDGFNNEWELERHTVHRSFISVASKVVGGEAPGLM